MNEILISIQQFSIRAPDFLQRLLLMISACPPTSLIRDIIQSFFYYYYYPHQIHILSPLRSIIIFHSSFYSPLAKFIKLLEFHFQPFCRCYYLKCYNVMTFYFLIMINLRREIGHSMRFYKSSYSSGAYQIGSQTGFTYFYIFYLALTPIFFITSFPNTTNPNPNANLLAPLNEDGLFLPLIFNARDIVIVKIINIKINTYQRKLYPQHINESKKKFHQLIINIFMHFDYLIKCFIYIFQMIENQMDGEAVPFIMIKERQQAGSIKYQFELTQQATQVFNSIKNKKIAVASIAGPQRTGKSFLSNRLLKRMTGFAIGPTTMPCTKGLWIWGKPVDIDQDSVLIIMDTEGLNSVQRDINVDLKIFALSILLSSVFIFNSIGHIDQKALQNMSYVLRISQNLKVTKSNVQKQSQMSKYFPYFYWVLRDFSLNLGEMSQSEYLENSLRPISNDKNDPKNQIRQKIRKLFTHRRCECFPRPVTQQNKLAHIQKLEYKDLREKFRVKMQDFERTFYETLPLKTIKGKPITGGIYLNLIRQYIEAMNTGKVPEILTSLERVLQSEARTITQEMRKKYNEAMGKIFNEAQGPTDESYLEKNHRNFLKQIQLKLQQKFRNWNDISKTGEYKNKFIESLENDFKEKLKRNNQLSQNLCATELNRFFNEYNFNELDSLATLEKNDGLIRQKFEEFTKKIMPYFEKCKNPRKFTYFVEKFPKKIFDFFDLLISRVKGFYNEEIMKLKADVKNAQGQCDSVKRIMKQQETLLNEKQKQLQLITYEKDNYRREIQKAEKLKQFQKQTQKMNKGQLKSSLQLYKTQVVQLQQRVQQLEDQNTRLKQMNQRLQREGGSKKFDISNFVQGSTAAGSQEGSRNQAFEDYPNQVVHNLAGLKNKLSSMLGFYQQKLSDDSLNVDQSILAQLERLRTEKHQALQKLRSQFRSKEEKYRQQKNKDREHYEKNIEVLNKHLDDIKNQNIELHERLTGKPESEQRLKNFMLQRKKLEESIKLKQNNINSLTILNREVQKKHDALQDRYNDIQAQLAMLKAQKANFESYKETFAFILRESINWVTNKNNKLKHSIKTLNQQDLQMIKAVFKELDYNPF